MKDYKIQKLTKRHVNYVSTIMQKRWDLKKEEADKEAIGYVVNDSNRAGWIVLYKNESIGTGLFDVENRDVYEKYSPWLFLLWIEPKYRGNNLGIELTKKRMKHAKKHGYKIIYLDTTGAEMYHKKLGWEKIEVVEKNTIMKWDLAKKFPVN
jgi:predicted N-acetyltransferase YhbS